MFRKLKLSLWTYRYSVLLRWMCFEGNWWSFERDIYFGCYECLLYVSWMSSFVCSGNQISLWTCFSTFRMSFVSFLIHYLFMFSGNQIWAFEVDFNLWMFERHLWTLMLGVQTTFYFLYECSYRNVGRLEFWTIDSQTLFFIRTFLCKSMTLVRQTLRKLEMGGL